MSQSREREWERVRECSATYCYLSWPLKVQKLPTICPNTRGWQRATWCQSKCRRSQMAWKVQVLSQHYLLSLSRSLLQPEIAALCLLLSPSPFSLYTSSLPPRSWQSFCCILKVLLNKVAGPVKSRSIYVHMWRHLRASISFLNRLVGSAYNSQVHSSMHP